VACVEINIDVEYRKKNTRGNQECRVECIRDSDQEYRVECIEINQECRVYIVYRVIKSVE
jgi:hypothetical protein